MDEKSRLVTAVSHELQEYFAKQYYGPGIDMFFVGVICIDAEFEPFHQVRPPKYSNRDLEFEYDIKLDFESFLNADEEQARRILGTAVLDSVKAIKGKKIGDFDLPRFEEDLRNFLDERGWLLPVTDARVDSADGPVAGDRPLWVLHGTDTRMDSANRPAAEDHPLEGDESTPSAPLMEDTFWSIIDKSRAMMTGGVDTERQCTFAADILSAMPGDQIVGFELTLRDLIRRANHFKVMAACKICEDYVSDDNYLYFRAGLISLGRDVYYGTLEDPDACAEVLVFNTEGEDVLYIADNAFLKRFGNDTDKTLPRDLASDYYNYDLELDEPAGEDWTEEELPRKYPRLWQLAHSRQ